MLQNRDPRLGFTVFLSGEAAYKGAWVATTSLGSRSGFAEKKGISITDQTINGAATKATDTIYVKLLNSSKTGIRSIDINIVENIMSDYKVDIFSTAFKRPLEIK